ncbi:hypothetical protein MmiAt1_07160 [Methanimicrococcus sp. At1]|uniref:S-layer family duplication domain-containing protein n=1 Tax=Methanimicrococcus hacksteinii TaxID=3028293 RepID=A0ABU3VP15_9EURY|nr:hypothetical protein [Methanimicrococcus sp. At1]MDV0445159.1 hypothetical protein [Methanimicrococcus sp. At1]
MEFSKNKYKMLAVIVICIAFIASVSVYYSFYSVSENNPAQIEKAAFNYLDGSPFFDVGKEDMYYVGSVRAGDKLFAVVKDDEFYRGFVTFERGLNLRWMPVHSSYGDVYLLSFYAPTEENYTIIFGTNIDQRIASYEYAADRIIAEGDEKGEVLYKNTIAGPDFIDVFERVEINNPENILLHPRQHSFDSEGNDITGEFENENIDIPRGMGPASTNTSGTGIVLVISAIILLFGVGIAIYIWKYED